MLCFVLINPVFQLEPDSDRCGILTVPEEWKAVGGTLQQHEKGKQERGILAHYIMYIIFIINKFMNVSLLKLDPSVPIPRPILTWL